MKKIVLLSALMTCSTLYAVEGPTNIILINLDDVDFGDFSCNGAYGYTTPNIDALASQGVRFTHFLACQPISGASRAGLLTGCYPNRIGFAGAPGPDSNYGIHPEEMTMGELVLRLALLERPVAKPSATGRGVQCPGPADLRRQRGGRLQYGPEPFHDRLY